MAVHKQPRQSDETMRAAQTAAIEWVKRFWPGVLKKLELSKDDRILLDLGKLMLSYAYGRPREMVEHTGDVVHTYVIESPALAVSVEAWQQAVVPPKNDNLH